ncbi:hypothetical protein CERSUDRAFT_110798 [Gelatoporia subvermispora B]|uniref:DUF726-domain-containing protein n=1 Tax=Ceriporiopsis subvermispora (strain B) TaxID=914234 RepID=M2PZA4_CERS8|nr:hypothetical protein CERSUDRAFT_110798 [Gelatoporia subvermispora B]
MPVVSSSAITPIEADIFDDDDDGWQDMPVVRQADEFANGLDEEDQKKYHYVPTVKKDSSVAGASNATGNLLDVDYEGNEWRAKVDQNENEYTRLRMIEEDESDEVHLRTRYLFDEDKAMTPLSQMQATKDLLTEAQRIAYVGVCSLSCKEMVDRLKTVNRKELKKSIQSMELWSLKIMGRLYYHMELATEEQKMIESLALHGIEAKDLVPSLMTTHTVANPEYDPAEARRQAEAQAASEKESTDNQAMGSTDDSHTPRASPSNTPTQGNTVPKHVQTTTKVLEDTQTSTLAGVSTHLSAVDKDVTLDIRWTVLCDLFLILVADSVYDARSRVLLETVALKLGLGWLDVVKFERRVTEALEIQEGVEKLEQNDAIEVVQKSSKKRRYMMLGLATLGGGLVIGLSAGLLAPVIGAGLGAAFTTIGITGTTSFLAGTAGAAVITTGGVLTGSGIAARGMANRTQYVRTFDILPLHNNKRVNCILTVSGFMTGPQDDVRLPFSVLDPVVGDVFSVLWEPEMIRETGSALKILTTEVLTQIGQTVLSATVMTALMSALQWPIILTKLGYLIDNPWSNALDRAKAAGSVLADVLLRRHLGVRPITLIGFSLGGRVIFYALVELAKQKAFGIVQDVFILGATVTAPLKTWLEVRSVVSGRFVNGYARNDWVLNYLFRATSGDLNTVAGLRPVKDVPGLENVDVTDKIAGHMSYRTFMPLILDQLGFPVSADYFDEPQEPDFEEDRIVVREGEDHNQKKKSWYSRRKKSTPSSGSTSRLPSTSSHSTHKKSSSKSSVTSDDLPPREGASSPSRPTSPTPSPDTAKTQFIPTTPEESPESTIPLHAGFDIKAMKEVIGTAEADPAELQVPTPTRFTAPPIPPPTHRTASAPPPLQEITDPVPPSRPSFNPPSSLYEHVVAGPSLSSADAMDQLSRSMSMSNIHDTEERSMTSSISRRFASEGPPSQDLPSMTFGGSDGSLWPAQQDGSLPYGAFGGPQTTFGIGAHPSRENFSSGLGAEPLRGFSAFRSDALSPPSENPFASPAVPGISFGAADGSITFAPSPKVEQDPWALGGGARTFGGDGTKRAATNPLDANPWQSS